MQRPPDAFSFTGSGPVKKFSFRITKYFVSHGLTPVVNMTNKETGRQVQFADSLDLIVM